MAATAKHLTMLVSVRDGKLDPTPAQKQLVAGFLKGRDGKAVEVRVAPKSNARSLRQNRLYWGVMLGTIAAETGNTTEDLHVVLRDMFLPRRFIQLGGKEVEVRKTTTDLTPQEFNHYMERVAAWASSELGIAIPLDNL